jgi:hypothetical protein
MLEGLSLLCENLNRNNVFSFSESNVIYFIRQLSAAYGCKNACTHCFSNPSGKIEQMTIDSFERIMNEIGTILFQTQKPLSFFHLGAATDPSMIKDYSKYALIWLNAIPEVQKIKFYTHGWYLDSKKQRREFDNFLAVLDGRKRKNTKFAISFDSFSEYARRDWKSYILNAGANIAAVKTVIPVENLRVEVIYSPEWNHCKPEFKSEYFRQAIDRDGMSYEHIKNMLQKYKSENDKSCARVTAGSFELLEAADIQITDAVKIVRDCGTIFPGGRAVNNHYRNKSKEEYAIGMETQKRNVLYSLEEYKYKYEGLVIYPSGSARFVDYQGFREGEWLNNGEQIIPYIKYFVREDNIFG